MDKVAKKVEKQVKKIKKNEKDVEKGVIALANKVDMRIISLNNQFLLFNLVQVAYIGSVHKKKTLFATKLPAHPE